MNNRKKSLQSLLTFLALITMTLSFGQTVVTIGTGTSTQGGPVSRFFRYHASEIIYLQSELNQLGTIESIAFDKRSGSDNNVIQNVEIYMKHTAATSLLTGTTSTVGYTLVYSGNFTNNASTGWMEVDLTTPFSYNNTDNLEVLVIKGSQAPLNSSQFPRYAYSSSINDRYRSYSDDSNAWSTSKTLGVQTGPPNARISFSQPCVPTFSSFTETACDSYTLNSQVYATSGTYTQTISNLAGCDSTITLNLTINHAVQGTDVQIACGSFIWIDNNTYTASNNTASHTLTGAASNGCDSIVTLDLTIINIDNTVTVNGIVLNANLSGATSYQWIDCGTGMPISSETNQSFSPSVNGDYQVEITSNGCTVISSCESVSNLSVQNLSEASFTIYPNPTSDYVLVSIPKGEGALTISTISGNVVREYKINSNQVMLDLNDLPKGMYMIHLNNDNYQLTKRLVLNK